MENYTAAPDLLKAKTILVTGAGDGIGRTAALTYAQHGATVILLGRTVAKLEKVYDEIMTISAPEPIIHPLDMQNASDEDYRILGDNILEQCGQLDGLLHNAAILGPRTPIQFYPVDSWMQLMQVNVNAPFMMTRALLPALQAAPEASVIFTSSSVGRKGRAYWGAYSVSKFAVEGFMQVLSDELRQTSSIRVNSIDPGATRTAMRKAAYPAEDPYTLKGPEDLMPLYLYLMGSDSKSVTGQALTA
ncbi:MAG: YciK family oxidoreductase [Gammaproteobacteria bacterium]|nr:YciK family oxidoreductase [Gammaproteobacteria bacterium]MDP2349368.1 YciK family oxidoreductase [Gammaproteobacteria bacterium]